MIYLTSKQEEALSPVKREVYHRRLMRDLERRQEEIIRDWAQAPKLVPLHAVIASCTMWIEPSRLKELSAALAIHQQYSEKLKDEVASLYEES